ncbi:DinB family protein [Peribacillus huizhouensis]|uniref:Damage-inducible protein DinB n=1 Tax=Peribacillus huizhouensis TaxID=1501239 RepID=A0ABR6CQI9_9BACI|nr:DinB family protein [Peribacillus huizhouensis]MBA9027288.1 putative damage-inducible protein DinB [Peribacillus huizhouensis]
MNTYCINALNQIKIALTKTVEIMDTLDETDLDYRPTQDKHSIGELLVHIASICKADLLIANGATQDEMSAFYSSVKYGSLSGIKTGLLDNFQILEESYLNYIEAELQQEITSFWGVTYSRYEWLLEILAHIYHHRGQLHAILVHCYAKDLKVLMFE